VAAILEARGVGKRFGPIEALRDASFAVQAGEIKALCGENGAGKSTLVKILTGLHQPDSGFVHMDGSPCAMAGPQAAQALGVAFVSQELSIVPHLSVLDNVWLGHREVPFLHRRAALRARARDVLDAVGLAELRLDRAAGTLSLGERQLLEIARMLAREARVFILDEPTATLSDAEIERVFQALRQLRAKGCAIVLITHRLADVFAVCDSVSVMRNGTDVGSFAVSEVDRPGLIALMLGRLLEEMYPPQTAAGAEAALVVRDLVVPGHVRQLSFAVARGQILCLAGQIGSGAAEAVRALAGLTYEARGEVELGGRPVPLGSPVSAVARGMRFVSDDRAAEGVFGELPVRENLLATTHALAPAFGIAAPRQGGRRARHLAGLVGLDDSRILSIAGELSGGNQQKVSVAKALGETEAGVLLMNEPTRGVDVGARAEIYRLMRRLCEAGYAIVMTSTDVEEVIGISDTVITMYRGDKVSAYESGSLARERLLADIVHPRDQE
jgi:ABC-type sugar transport system ATPase subunit